MGINLTRFLAGRMRVRGCRGLGSKPLSEYWIVMVDEWDGSAAHEGAIAACSLQERQSARRNVSLGRQTSWFNALSTMS